MNLKKIKKKWIIIASVIVVWFVVYITNETSFLYFTPQNYVLPKKEMIASPDYAPVEILNPASDSAILFLHGYKATPKQFRYLAENLKRGYNIFIPLLPGHGTNIKIFQKTYYSQWRNRAKDKYSEIRKKYKKVYVCGLSMGGLIALSTAEEFCGKTAMAPDGIIAIGAPVFLNNVLKEGVLYDWRLYIARYLAWVIKKLPKKPGLDRGLSDVPDEYDNYNFPKQAFSLKMGMYGAKKNLDKITCPVLLMQAKGDTDVPYENLFYIAKNISSDNIRVKTFDLRLKRKKSTKHLLILYPETKTRVLDEIKEFLGG